MSFYETCQCDEPDGTGVSGTVLQGGWKHRLAEDCDVGVEERLSFCRAEMQVRRFVLALRKAIQSFRLRLHSGLRQSGGGLSDGCYCP